jgi:LDH2 family malate/lactate/ureidoglycolate dehydrogenase
MARAGHVRAKSRSAKTCGSNGDAPRSGQRTFRLCPALSIESFAQPEEFKRQVDVAVRTMRAAERLPGIERIWLPGEQSHAKRLERVENGVPMPKPLRDSLDAIARDLGIAPLA